jgi:hypothetical protein
VLFEGTGNVLQESANFFWDNTNSRLGIGTATPTFGLDVNGTARVQGDVQMGLLGAAQTNFRFNAGTTGGQGYASIYGSGATGIYFGLGSSTNGLSGTGLSICRAYLNEYGNNAYGFVGLDNTIAMTFRFGAFGSSVEAMRLTNTSVILRPTTGNVLIGTTTDAGFRLDVNGTARVTGAGSTGTTFGLTVRNSSGTLGLTVRDDGTVYNRFMNTTQLSQDGAGNAGYIQGNFCIGAVAYAGASAVLDVRSTTRGFLPPRMTTTEKNAIASPASGLVVYDTTLGKLCVRGASAWETITSV